MTQNERLEVYLRAHPEATVMEITLALRPFVANPRARISDLRAAGLTVVCERRSDGQKGFRIVEPVGQLVMAL